MSSTATRFGFFVCASAVATGATAAAAAERIRVRIEGDFQQWVVVGDQNISGRRDAETATNTVDQKHNSELFFIGETKLDNGITVGFEVDLELNTDVGGQIGDSFLSLEHDRWGLTQMGDTSNAAVDMHVGAPDGGISVNDGDLIGIEAFVLPEGFETSNTLIDTTFLQLGDDTSGKVNYFSPRIGGVRLGLSYIPQFEYGGSNNSSLTRIDGRGPTTDGVAMAVNYTGSMDSIGGVGVEAYAGGLFADVAPANGSGNPWGIGAGVVFTFGGFEVGGSFASASGDAPLGQSVDGHSFDVGIAYAFGPYQVGLTYIRGVSRGNRSDSSDQRLDQAILSGTYALGPGIDLVGGLFYFDADGEKSVAEEAQGVTGNHGYGFTSGFKLAF